MHPIRPQCFRMSLQSNPNVLGHCHYGVPCDVLDGDDCAREHHWSHLDCFFLEYFYNGDDYDDVLSTHPNHPKDDDDDATFLQEEEDDVPTFHLLCDVHGCDDPNHDACHDLREVGAYLHEDDDPNALDACMHPPY
mmetsp:Transcript_2530/g.3429  ORF Transcript_2530/g.3429 Transcript_2530/m.3429 type:complete len:136 (-) Transcript_2530:218-625(-)